MFFQVARRFFEIYYSKKVISLRSIISPHDIPSGGKSATNTSPLGLPATGGAVAAPGDGPPAAPTGPAAARPAAPPAAPTAPDGSAPTGPPVAPPAAPTGPPGAPAPVSTAEPCWVDPPNQLVPQLKIQMRQPHLQKVKNMGQLM